MEISLIRDFLVGDINYWKSKYNECINEMNNINAKYDVNNTRSRIAKLTNIKVNNNKWRYIHIRKESNEEIINEYYNKRAPDNEIYKYNKTIKIYQLRINYNKKWKNEISYKPKKVIIKNEEELYKRILNNTDNTYLSIKEYCKKICITYNHFKKMEDIYKNSL